MPDPDVPPVAARQCGVFTADQALDAGCSAGQVRRRRETGRWIRVAGRGLADAGGGGSGAGRRGDGPAAMLAWGAQLTWPGAVVCRRTAAALHGFPVSGGSQAQVLVGRGRHPLLRVLPCSASGRCDPPVLVRGLMVTGQLTTMLDCLAFLPFEEASQAQVLVGRGSSSAPGCSPSTRSSGCRPARRMLDRPTIAAALPDWLGPDRRSCTES
jgi:hypothetical protein